MKQRLAILGSTGSIGVQTLDIVRENPDFFEVRVLTANSNWQRLAAQAREFDADTAVCATRWRTPTSRFTPERRPWRRSRRAATPT